MKLDRKSGLVNQAKYCASPNQDERPEGCEPEAIIIHCISLPPGHYGGAYVEQFFCNQLEVNHDPYFSEIAHLTVSSHFYIKRCGELVQFVPTTMRAWHAGESACLGKPAVNNFSIGIELEGLDTDESGYTAMQYEQLRLLTLSLREAYPAIIAESLFAHSDIAPGRKADPGPYFNWQQVV
jgi:AmpD protein